MNIILFGFKHSGKSTIGKHVAKMLGKKFIDTDDFIENLYEKKTDEKLRYWEIYEKKGESFFRGLEKEVVQTLENETDAIIATGGGCVLDPDNAKRLQQLGVMLYIFVPKEQLKKRMFEGRIPLFISDGPMAFDELYAKRKMIYESLAAKRLFVTDVEDGIYHLLEEVQKLQDGK
jgi:shikimate kinase